MKNYLFLLTFIVSFSFFGQELKPIPAKVQKYHQQKRNFEQYDVFTKNNSLTESETYKKEAKDATILDVKTSAITEILSEKPQTIELTFPYKNGELTVELFKENIFVEGFDVIDQNKTKLDYHPGVYYRGIVKNNVHSIAAFSFFKNRVYGLASIVGGGNIVVGKLKTNSHYISYTDNTLTKDNPFHCGVENIPENQNKAPQYSTNMDEQSRGQGDACVKIYYEIAYQPYLDNYSNTDYTVDWMTAVHNNISTLYENDDIQVALNEILLWTEQDPYYGSYDENLEDFRANRPSFNGDLGHLVNSPSTTSVAYLNSLCGSFRYAYSGVSNYYEDVPTYSWTINAMTHEMGHALGSPHTHACYWNGDDSAIDGCGPTAGFSEGCDGPIPDSGTIMSYCHLLNYVGIDLANGFGPQPAALIQNNINSKPCLGTDCISSCEKTLADVEVLNITNTSLTINFVDDIADSWKYNIYPYNYYTPGWTTTTNNENTIDNLQPNTYYIIDAMNQCDQDYGFTTVRKIVLTNGDYCGGDTFVDTGGEYSDYGDSEALVKTFYPGTNEKLTMTFTEFNLEGGYDFMSIYNGESTDFPVFPNGNLLTGNLSANLPSFEATNPSGAITVKFNSDYTGSRSGWKANFTCSALGVSRVNADDFTVYPNPAQNQVHITSQHVMQGIDIRDINGKQVLSKKLDGVKNTSCNLESFSNGVYFMTISGKNGTETVKLIKG